MRRVQGSSQPTSGQHHECECKLGGLLQRRKIDEAPEERELILVS